MRSPRSNIEWFSWGEWDPLYGVASLFGRNKRGNKPWTAKGTNNAGCRRLALSMFDSLGSRSFQLLWSTPRGMRRWWKEEAFL